MSRMHEIANQMLQAMLLMESSVPLAAVTVMSSMEHHLPTMNDHRLKHYYSQPIQETIIILNWVIAYHLFRVRINHYLPEQNDGEDHQT